MLHLEWQRFEPLPGAIDVLRRPKGKRLAVPPSGPNLGRIASHADQRHELDGLSVKEIEPIPCRLSGTPLT